MIETETSERYKYSYKSGSVLNYTIHLCPKEMETIEGKKRGKKI